MTLIELARKLRPFIEKAAMFLNDEDALEAVQLFPHWATNIKYFVENNLPLANFSFNLYIPKEVLDEDLSNINEKNYCIFVKRIKNIY